VWPAVALLGAFILLELVWKDPGDPRVLAQAITLYSLVTWAGMLAYGRAAWLESGDGFSVYFGFLSRAAIFGTRVRDGAREVILRKPLGGLAHLERRAGAVAFFAVMLGSVAFDGLSRSTWWFERIYDIQVRFSTVESAERAVMLFNLAGLILVVALVAVAYLVAIRVAEGVVGGGDFTGVFLCSLVPIAIVYALSHYFSSLLINGQFAIPLLSDPYGQGWNLLGTAGFQPNLTLLTPNVTWYTQVTVLVLGHVAGLVVAHDRAIAVSPSPRIALRTQYAMLTLMVLYTVAGMWLLSIG
jgi:hypothetical protein